MLHFWFWCVAGRWLWLWLGLGLGLALALLHACTLARSRMPPASPGPLSPRACNVSAGVKYRPMAGRVAQSRPWSLQPRPAGQTVNQRSRQAINSIAPSANPPHTHTRAHALGALDALDAPDARHALDAPHARHAPTRTTLGHACDMVMDGRPALPPRFASPPARRLCFLFVIRPSFETRISRTARPWHAQPKSTPPGTCLKPKSAIHPGLCRVLAHSMLKHS